MRVAVIGAGPSGLVTLKYLTQAHLYLGCGPVEARLFEYQPQVGGTFAARVYEEAELVSSKQLTTFSDFRAKPKGDFLTPHEYVEYLNEYASQFALWPHILLESRVLNVARGATGHVVTFQTSGHSVEHWECDAVAVCSGLHVEPNIPHIPGLNNVPTVFHSSEFKERRQFGDDKTVMVVGSGETGADVAFLAATSPTKQVVMCHRDGVHFAPKTNQGPIVLPIIGRKSDPSVPGIPVDISRSNLFDTTYTHPILRNSMLLWEYYMYYVRALLWLSGGNSMGIDQWVGAISPERDHPSKIFFNKSDRVVPYISARYRPSTPGWDLWIYAIRSALVQRPIRETNDNHVDMAPWPESIDSTGLVQFRNNGQIEYERMKTQKVRPDVVVLCTGYRQSFPFFSATQPPYATPSDADVRGIWKRSDPTVAFIGFVRPNLGAIPPLSEMQAQLWVTHMLAPQRIPRPLKPEDEGHYRLLPPPESRIQYGVDHESYAYQLALDLDSAPGLVDMLRLSRADVASLRMLVFWAAGANLNTKYRLQGPWRWDGARDVLASDEFWETITRRPLFFGHFAGTILPIMIFGPISAFLWIYTTIFGQFHWASSTIKMRLDDRPRSYHGE